MRFFSECHNFSYHVTCGVVDLFIFYLRNATTIKKNISKRMTVIIDLHCICGGVWTSTVLRRQARGR